MFLYVLKECLMSTDVTRSYCKSVIIAVERLSIICISLYQFKTGMFFSNFNIIIIKLIVYYIYTTVIQNIKNLNN